MAAVVIVVRALSLSFSPCLKSASTDLTLSLEGAAAGAGGSGSEMMTKEKFLTGVESALKIDESGLDRPDSATLAESDLISWKVMATLWMNKVPIPTPSHAHAITVDAVPSLTERK